MALPRGGPESPSRPEDSDPFLEFDSEGAAIRSKETALDSLLKPKTRVHVQPEPPPPQPDSWAQPEPLAHTVLEPGPELRVEPEPVPEPEPEPRVERVVLPVWEPRSEAVPDSRPAIFSRTGLNAFPDISDEISAAPKQTPRGRGDSMMSPAFAFAFGVAGLVSAMVAYYQLAHFLSERPAVVSAPPTKPAAALTPTPQTSNPPAPTNAVATPVAPPPVAPPPKIVETGWVELESPIDLTVFERGRPRGSSRAGRLKLPIGVHELDLVSDPFEVRQSVSVTIVAGETARSTVTMPMGSLSINALPWANVWVNGMPVGTTPLANLRVPVGSHEVVWKHPTLGERRQTVIVKAKTPVQIGLDLNKQSW